jgi:hypothetical protein
MGRAFAGGLMGDGDPAAELAGFGQESGDRGDPAPSGASPAAAGQASLRPPRCVVLWLNFMAETGARSGATKPVARFVGGAIRGSR